MVSSLPASFAYVFLSDLKLWLTLLQLTTAASHMRPQATHLPYNICRRLFSKKKSVFILLSSIFIYFRQTVFSFSLLIILVFCFCFCPHALTYRNFKRSAITTRTDGDMDGRKHKRTLKTVVILIVHICGCCYCCCWS